MRQQKGNLFRKGPSWFVRYCDNVLENGVVKRKVVCKKLHVPYGGKFTSEASVRPFVRELLAPVNAGTLNAQSTMTLADFVDGPYFEWAERSLRTCTIRGYRQMWNCCLKPRVGRIALRDFRTVHGERLLADLAAQNGLGRRTLQHHKAFLSGVFVQAKRLGILDGLNPMQGTSIPRVSEPKETHAYSLEELNTMLLVLTGQARAIVLLAALTGLRKSEIRGLRWADFTGRELSVQRSVWNGVTNETKTAKSKAPVPVVKMLADTLHTLHTELGVLAAPDAPIFQAGNGKPLNLDNLARRTIIPALTGTKARWYGWHGLRRSTATLLHSMGIDDRTIQAILRHSNITLTQNVYVKSLSESQVAAMDTLEAALQNKIAENGETCTNLATPQPQLVN